MNASLHHRNPHAVVLTEDELATHIEILLSTNVIHAALVSTGLERAPSILDALEDEDHNLYCMFLT